MSVPELVPEILAMTKLLQTKVLLVSLMSKRLFCRSEIPREAVFRQPITVMSDPSSEEDISLDVQDQSYGMMSPLVTPTLYKRT